MAQIEAETELPDPAEDLRGDIEQAIEKQQAPEPKEAAETPEKPERAEREQARERVRADDLPPPDRDEKGRFKPKVEPEPGSEPAGKAQDRQEPPPAPDVARVEHRPPPGFSVASKAAWEDLPQHVRDDIVKREVEISNGFQRYSGLGRFAEEAERNGTTLQSAVSDYVAVESALRRDFVGGVEFICQRMGIDPRSVTQAMANRYFPAPGEQQAQQQQQQIDPNAIANYVANMVRTEAQQREIDSSIAVFASDPKNKFFPNLRQDMAQIVQAGKATNLQEAYEAACWLNPEIRTILISEANGGRDKQASAVASRARNAAKAVGGSPSSGANPDAKDKRQNLSIDDEIRAAIDAQIGA